MAKYPGSFIINEVGTRKELASIYGVSERTIYRWLNKAAKESGLSPKISKKTHPRDTTLANFKGTRKQLAKKYGVSERTAYRWLEKAKARGTEIPSRRSESKYPGAAVMMNIITTSAKTNKQIAEELGVSPGTASRWVRRTKLEIPPLVTDLRKTGQYKLRRKKTANGNWYSWYEYVGDNTTGEDIGEPWEVPEPEDIGEPWEVPEPDQEDIEEPWEVPDYDYYEDDRPEWEKLGMRQDTYENLVDIMRKITENELLVENSLFNNLEHPKAIRYLQKYIRYQYEEVDPSLFYDADTRQTRFDSDWVSFLPIWGSEFETWLETQIEIDEYEI